MTWPHWIDELKERYLADEGNVFVLYGEPKPARGESAKRWTVDDEALDTTAVLVRFLRRTREIVAVLRPAPLPSRLEFADMSDRTRFENLVKAWDLIQGRALPLVETDPHQALGRIWRALSTVGTAQAYIVTDADRLWPGHRKRLEPIPGAPDLVLWSGHASLTQSNNLLVFLAQDRDSIRADLIASAVCIDLARVPAPATPEEASTAPTPPPPPALQSDDAPPPPPALEGASLREQLQREIVRALVSHPEDHRPSGLPVMDAVARIVTAHRPDLWGSLEMTVDADGVPVISGRGEEQFFTTWRSDMALDAAGGMLLKNLPTAMSEQSPPPLDDTALSALVRRVERILKS